ncbi:SH3 domain-containing protein [Sneathiella sp. CAU 1612]|uniref:SH3 domain-containing protein n=1 Tax=Sneathiella sedimenti TaxID=2816034 RepID=A0ABS3F262_9PROT|nr:SH3 domain-containing protein [Sneathiella sedimenti]MBO0332594.1 SH3 domain-containing protein [Sneathiella sedimenti]
MKRSFALLVFFVLFFLAPQPEAGPTGSETGLPLPRFVSLSSDKVNVRAGPGTRYPIKWVFVREGWPVEVVEEYELWRQIRDIDGSIGWVHRNLISSRRTLIITGDVRAVYEDPDESSPVVLLAEPGVVGKLEECDARWCEIEIAGITGWLMASQFYGVYENEKIR